MIFDEYSWGKRQGYIYHYTSKYYARQILKDKLLKAGASRIHHFGYGVFMTKLSPCMKNDELCENNYRGNQKFLNRLQSAFAFKDDGTLNLTKIYDHRYPSRDIWRSNNDINLNQFEFYLIMRS